MQMNDCLMYLEMARQKRELESIMDQLEREGLTPRSTLAERLDSVGRKLRNLRFAA